MTYKRISDMTPTEFERCCLDILSGYAEEEHLNGFEITHNKIIKASDGRYQIDVYAKFTAMGARFKILCECKKYKYRVGREKVAVLHRKLDSIGAQKGILISTSDFQSGALEYAKAHGIALIIILNTFPTPTGNQKMRTIHFFMLKNTCRLMSVWTAQSIRVNLTKCSRQEQ